MQTSFPQIENIPPQSNELEVSVFGPGVGECIVVHLGNEQWMIVDSCLDRSSKQPVAIQHLENLGIDVSSAVKIVLVSHWHDDHIRGLSKIVKKCSGARVCCPSAFLGHEFLSLVSTYSGRLSLVDYHTSGTREISKVIDILKQRVTAEGQSLPNCIIKVGVDRVLFDEDNGSCKCHVMALSPSDKAQMDALLSFADMIPSDEDERITIPSLKTPNDNAVALWINFNGYMVLLGSDLEETSDPQTGWSAVVNSSIPRKGKACIFKVPHHGSPNGHSEDVWSEMVDKNPVSLLTAFSRGVTPRPQPDDVIRLKKYTDQLFSTSLSRVKLPKRENTVERILKGMVSNRRVLAGDIGHIQVRVNSSGEMKVNLKPPAIKL